MKKLLASTSALLGFLALANSAIAADAIAADPGYDWSGFYAGIQGGYSWADSAIDDGIGFDPEITVEGAYGGGVLGAQWQFDHIVIGVEGEANLSDADGSEDVSPPLGNFVTGDIDWFGSISGKLGFAMDRWMVFGTAGLAFADATTGQNGDIIQILEEEKESFVGYTVGGGIDFAMTDNVIVGVQYRYYDFGSEFVTFPSGDYTDRDFDLTQDTISAHLIFKF